MEDRVTKKRVKRERPAASVFTTDEFKKLQLKWYKKLDSTGFDDIERSGVNRQLYFDEYGGILKRQLSHLKRRINSSTLYHFSLLSKFSFTKITMSALDRLQPTEITQFITQKSQKGVQNNQKNLTKSSPASPAASAAPDSTNTTTAPVLLTFNDLTLKEKKALIRSLKTYKDRLSPSDIVILRKTGDGATVRDISRFLRSYHSHYHKKGPGPSGKPYSVFYVHSRLKVLMKLCKLWSNLGEPDKLIDLIRDVAE